MSNNWIVENIQNALDTWNDKLNEIWRLLSQSPTEFKGGTVWNVMVNINGTLKAVGYALLVLFFLMGIMKHYNSMQEIKRPEQALKLFIRFVLAKAAVTWGLDLMMAMFTIVQGIISKIMASSGIGGRSGIYLPRNDKDHRGLRLLGEHSAVGSNADRKFADLGAVLYPDSHGVRADVQALYVCCNRADSTGVVRRGGNREYRQELSGILCRRMSGGRDHRACLRHLFAVCVSSAVCQYRCLGNYAGLDLCRGDRIQYVGACRDSEAVGSGCE